MKELIAFLRARLDQDVRIARDACVEGDISVRIEIDDGQEQAQVAVLSHVGNWDPARVLAEVDAKRQTVDLCEEWEEWAGIGEITPNATWSDEAAGGAVARVLSLMALPYADHPDYDPAWAPASAVSTACYCTEINELCGHCKD